MNRVKIRRILKAAESAKKNIVTKRQKEYFKPFFNDKKGKLAARYATEFALELDELLKGFRDDCVKLIRSGIHVYPGVKIRKADKNKKQDDLDKRFNEVVSGKVRKPVGKLGQILTKSLKDAYEKHVVKGFAKDAAPNLLNDLEFEVSYHQTHMPTRDYLESKKIEWAKQVAEETEKIIKRELVKGYEDGEHPYNVAFRIQEATGFSYARSEAIARTEIHIASEYTRYVEIMSNPYAIGFRWDSSTDSRTRRTHVKADNQKRAKGKPFNVGGYELRFPGDTSLGAPPGEIINCRCTLHAVYEREGLQSDTIYDEPDAGTLEWLKRQDEAFQIEYWGGRAKRKLGEEGHITLEDIKKPTKEIVAEISPVTVTPSEITQKSSIPEPVAEEVVKRANALWLHGELSNTEMNVTLNAKTGRKAFANITDGKYGRITDESKKVKDWLDFLKKAKPRSLAIMHNHNNISRPSTIDLKLFLEHESVQYMLVVDGAGNLYILEKSPDVVYDVNEIMQNLYTELRDRYLKMQKLGYWRELDANAKSVLKNSMYYSVIDKNMMRAGVRYERFENTFMRGH